MLKNILFTLLMATIFLNSCSSDKRIAKEGNGKVRLVCHKEKDTLFIKVTNENGKRNSHILTLKILADVMKVDVKDFL